MCHLKKDKDVEVRPKIETYFNFEMGLKMVFETQLRFLVNKLSYVLIFVVFMHVFKKVHAYV